MAKNKDFISFPEYMPELLDQWDWEKNSGIDPYTIGRGSDKKFYWKCLNDERHPSFLAAVSRRTRKLRHDKNHGCPVCANRTVIKGINDLASQYPKMLVYWDWEKNTEIGLFPDKISPGSIKKAHWKCPDCGYEWEASIQHKCIKGTACPVCAGNTIKSGYNDMATKHPELVPLLHPTLNGDFNPSTVASHYNGKLAWQCENHKEHIYWTRPTALLHGSRCPYCAGQKVLKGFNDLATLHPELLKEWDWEKNIIVPTEVTSGSNRKVHWKCKYGHEWEAEIDRRVSRSSGCPQCNCNHTSFFECLIYSACCHAFGKENVLHRDTSIFGFELDIVVPEYKIAFEPGSWFWHKDERKREIDMHKTKTLHKAGWNCFIIYDSHTEVLNPQYPIPYGWHYITENIGNGNTDLAISLLSQILSIYTDISTLDWKQIEIEATALSTKHCLPNESLASKRPNLLDEWDYDKNLILPNEVLPYAHMNIWWKCPHGHSYQLSPKQKRDYCPFCNETLILPGINHISDIIENIDDIWDTLANGMNNLHLEKVGAKKRNHVDTVHWICPHCGFHFTRYISTLLHGKRPNHNNCPHCGEQVAIIKENPEEEENGQDDAPAT